MANVTVTGLNEIVANMQKEMQRVNAQIQINAHIAAKMLQEETVNQAKEVITSRTGNLVNNIKQDVTITGTKYNVSCGVDEQQVPYIKYVLYGTSKMPPRDFLTKTATMKGKEIVTKMINKL